MSWMRSEPSCHSNKPFYLQPATYITMQNKKGRTNEAKVLSLRAGELGCFYFVLYLNPKDSCYLASVAHTLCNQQVPVPLERLFDLSFYSKEQRWWALIMYILIQSDYEFLCRYCKCSLILLYSPLVLLERLTQMLVVIFLINLAFWG